VILLAIFCVAAAGYQVTALLACIAHLRKQEPSPASLPAISILKPVHQADSHFFAALHSHAVIDYPEFEVLIGVREPNDAAIPQVERLRQQFPLLQIRLVHCPTDAPNAKVGVLEALASVARHPVWVVNDSDIHVEPDYLQRLTAYLDNPAVGLVTCLYRASADTFPAEFEALGISTEFAPSTLVAPFVGVNEFGLGSTLAFRAADWQRAGGFTGIRDYVADDYQVGKRISALGLKVVMSPMPVATHIGGGTWRDIWSHQVRWARTIRLSRGLYYGLPVTNATLWALLALGAGWWWTAGVLLTLRMQVALLAGVAILRDPIVERRWYLVPLRDLWSFGVWTAGAFGREVLWRGRRLRLDRAGRILRD
jgi:ceramide glucosyltransferase